MSLLLCFFVLLLSMATFDAKKLNEVEASLKGALSILNGGSKTEVDFERVQQAAEMVDERETSESIKMIESLIIEYNEMTKLSKGPSNVLQDGDEGFLIRLPAAVLFEQGESTIKNEDALLFIKRMASVIKELPENLHISVRGHTSDLPPGEQSIYKDNWQLSAHRALAVAKELINNNISPKKISACGNAEYKPIAPNNTQEDRAKNERVDVYFYSKDNALNKGQTSILDAEQKSGL